MNSDSSLGGAGGFGRSRGCGFQAIANEVDVTRTVGSFHVHGKWHGNGVEVSSDAECEKWFAQSVRW